MFKRLLIKLGLRSPCCGAKVYWDMYNEVPRSYCMMCQRKIQ